MRLCFLLVLLGLGLAAPTQIDGGQIRSGSVLLDRLGPIPNNTVLGNNTGGSSSPTALTIPQLKALLALAIADVGGLQAALDGKLSLTGGTLTGTLTLNNGANSLRLTAGSVDHTYVEFYARTAAPGSQSGYFGYPGAGSADMYFANNLSGGNLVFTTPGKVYFNGKEGVVSDDPRLVYQGGPLSSRPAATSETSGLWYFATDIGGGTLYRSTGSSWQQVAAGLGTFTSSSAGLAPPSGGGAANFLRADGTWAAPTAGIPSSPKAGLPSCSSGSKGQLYFTNDVKAGLGTLSYCDGSTWQFLGNHSISAEGYSSLQAAVNTAQSTKLKLWIGPGTYTLASALQLGDYADVECVAGAKLQPAGPTTTVLLMQASFLRLRGCSVDTSNQTNYTGVAVDVWGISTSGDQYGFSVDDLRINSNYNQQGTCLRLFSAGSDSTPRWVSQTRWRNISCRGFNTGVLLQTTGGLASDYVNGNAFNNLFVTSCVYQFRIDARSDAEISGNQIQNFNFQTGSSTSRSITISGRATGNKFYGKTWDWGVNNGVPGKIAYEITGLGNSYSSPLFNQIEDPVFGWDASNLSIAPRNYFVTRGLTSSPLENQVAYPGSDENRALLGDQDDTLSGATYRYAVSTVSQTVTPSCRSGGLSDLFGRNGKCTWAMPSGGGSVTLRVDLSPDGNGYGYIDTLGVQFMNSGEQAPGITLSVGDTAPAQITVYSTTSNTAMNVMAQNGGIGGVWQVRYLDFTFSRSSAGNISVQRLFARDLVRKGPFWAQGPAGGVLWNQGGQVLQSTAVGGNGAVLMSSGSANGPQMVEPGPALQTLRQAGQGRAERVLPSYSFDFITQGVSGTLTNGAISSGTNTTAPATGVTTANHPGVVLFRSSTTANSGYQYSSKADAFRLGGGENFEAVFWTPASFTNTTVRLGFIDVFTASDAVDGVYLEIPSSGAAVCKAANNSTRTTSSPVATLSNSTWYHLVINVTSGSSATCTLYSEAGVQQGAQTVTSNIPTAAGRETGFGVVATNSGTTATDLIAMDYIGFYYTTPLQRGP